VARSATGFLDVYGLRAHRLARLTRNAYGYAGSVVNRAGVDCVVGKGARLVASSATWDDTTRRYDVERTFYALHEGVLSMVPRLTRHDSVSFSGLARYPELAVLVPFPSCTAVTGTS
jgi:hypothetical protein